MSEGPIIDYGTCAVCGERIGISSWWTGVNDWFRPTWHWTGLSWHHVSGYDSKSKWACHERPHRVQVSHD